MGGGGDGGYAAKQAEIEAKKQQARDALNRLFGVAGSALPKPDEANFRTPPTPGHYTNPGPDAEGGGGGSGWVDQAEGAFDEQAYNKAMEEWRGKMAETKGNRLDRNRLYTSVRRNAFRAGERSLEEDRDQAARKLKFELFARGLNGGSEDVNQNALLGRTYSNGLLDLSAKADAAKADFRGADETTRLNLLQSIDAGMDMGSALSAATGNMKVAADKAAADAQGASLGHLFDNAGRMYQYNQYAQRKQAGQQSAWNRFPGNTWNRLGSGTGATGVSTRTN
jgi:hypothetical protein